MAEQRRDWNHQPGQDPQHGENQDFDRERTWPDEEGQRGQEGQPSRQRDTHEGDQDTNREQDSTRQNRDIPESNR